jgi:hypothetical protein
MLQALLTSFQDGQDRLDAIALVRSADRVPLAANTIEGRAA